MKYLTLITTLACTKHIHNRDMLAVKPGMTYEQVTQEIGLPNKLVRTEPIKTQSGNFETARIYVWKSHENMNDWIKDCYFSFIDDTLIQVKCH